MMHTTTPPVPGRPPDPAPAPDPVPDPSKDPDPETDDDTAQVTRELKKTPGRPKFSCPRGGRKRQSRFLGALRTASRG